MIIIMMINAYYIYRATLQRSQLTTIPLDSSLGMDEPKGGSCKAQSFDNPVYDDTAQNDETI